jgi:hypothetical protein
MIYLEDNNKENIRKKRLNKMFKAEEIGKKKEYFSIFYLYFYILSFPEIRNSGNINIFKRKNIIYVGVIEN